MTIRQRCLDPACEGESGQAHILPPSIIEELYKDGLVAENPTSSISIYDIFSVSHPPSRADAEIHKWSPSIFWTLPRTVSTVCCRRQGCWQICTGGPWASISGFRPNSWSSSWTVFIYPKSRPVRTLWGSESYCRSFRIYRWRVNSKNISKTRCTILSKVLKRYNSSFFRWPSRHVPAGS